MGLTSAILKGIAHDRRCDCLRNGSESGEGRDQWGHHDSGSAGWQEWRRLPKLIGAADPPFAALTNVTAHDIHIAITQHHGISAEQFQRLSAELGSPKRPSRASSKSLNSRMFRLKISMRSSVKLLRTTKRYWYVSARSAPMIRTSLNSAMPPRRRSTRGTLTRQSSCSMRPVPETLRQPRNSNAS